MKLPKRITYCIEAIIVLFIDWAVRGIFTHSSRLESVTVIHKDEDYCFFG